jgi:hypothetical protein
LTRRIFPGSHWCERLSCLSHTPRGYRLSDQEIIATLYNSGQHLYYDRRWPCQYKPYDQRLFFLPFREFCGHGRSLGDVHIQHFGHLYGLSGGPAQVAVEYNGIRWELRCEPKRFYYIVDFDGPQAVFANRMLATLPWQLLSHG